MQVDIKITILNKDNIFEMGAEVKVRWFLGTQVSPDNRYFAAAHDETGNSFFKIVDVENREVIFESNIYKQIEGLRLVRIQII